MKKNNRLPSFSSFPANHAPFLPSKIREKYTEKVRMLMLKDNKPFKYQEQPAGFFRYKVDYPELIAKTCNEGEPNKLITRKPAPNKWLPSCSFSLLMLKCASGHVVSKAIYCGREWCETCGQKKSIIHRRRVSRWIQKSQQITTMGYLVITIPKKIRQKFISKLDLSNFRTFIRRKIKREKPGSADKGFFRFHWAGDCKKCKGKKCEYCNYTGADSEYHPHLNILLNTSGYLDSKILKNFKTDIESWFTAYTKIDCTGKGNINYQYSSKENKHKHWISYVTRATWRFYNEKICTLIKGFHTGSTFGKWEKNKIDNSTIAVEKKCCPVCLQEDGVIHNLKKIELTSKENFNFANKIEIAPGVFYHKIINN